MRKSLNLMFLSFFVVGILCLSVLVAEKNQNQAGQENSENSKNTNFAVKDGEYIQIIKGEKNKTRIKEGNFSVDCDCNLSQEKENNKTKLKIKLSNGKNSEIKIMPETASENAIQKLMIKNCNLENNCTIVLKEVGKNETAKAVYEMQIEKRARVFGVFKIRVQARAQVDAETGEVKIKKPWWAKLVNEQE